MHIYLDESGDLGFDFGKKATATYFIITLLVVKDQKDLRKINKAVERTLKNKINVSKRGKKQENELKGSKTSIAIKKYFFRQLEEAHLEIYTIALNKKRVYGDLKKKKERLYNYISRLVIEKIPFSGVRTKVIITLDKRKDKGEVGEFNSYLFTQLQGLLPPRIPLEIYHRASFESKGIQATDMFSRGIFRKYQRKDQAWYTLFREKIQFETEYLPNKKGEP